MTFLFALFNSFATVGRVAAKRSFIKTAGLLGVAFLCAACASATPLPTLTLAPSTLTAPPPTPAATMPSTATPTPAPTVTPSPTPPVLNPLTGLAVSDPAQLNRRPLAVKIAHFPQWVRQSQSGLSLADNVWEHYAEGGVTRFTAIFLSNDVERIGNIRSARLIDTYLGEAYSAMVVASGSSQGTLERFKQTDFYDRVVAEATGYKGCPVLCREQEAALTTDKVFSSSEALWQLTDELKLNGKQALTGLVFASAEPPAGEAISTVHIDFQLDHTIAEWRYEIATGHYTRWIDSFRLPELDPHIDTLTGQQITTTNVVVLFVEHSTSNIHADDTGLHFSYEITLKGEGVAKVFRNGRMYEATWKREASLPRLYDATGAPLALAPGRIWFEVLSAVSPFKVKDDLFSARFKGPNPNQPTTP